MDIQIKELVGIAAAIGGNCLPCLRYHFAEAIKAGCGIDDIKEAMELAKVVKNRPIQEIDKLAISLIEKETER